MSTSVQPTTIPRIFVSHSHLDNVFCRSLAAHLRSALNSSDPTHIFYDERSLQSGDDWMQRIQHEVIERPIFLVVLTPHAVASPFVKQETNLAIRKTTADSRRRIFPLLVEPCDYDLLAPFLGSYQFTDFVHTAHDRAFDGLVRALRTAPEAGGGARGAGATSPTPSNPLLPSLGPAPAPAGATPTLQLTPNSLYPLGFRGYTLNGVEFVLPPLCPVPGGIFMMGSDRARDKQALDNEMPQYPVEVGGFALAQHPVTVAEYACAVRAKAVGEPPLHTYPNPKESSSRLRSSERPPDERVAPEWQGKKLNWAAQRQYPDHPVVQVSWTDATAYAAWLSGLTGQPWRLPTEAEWEKAARWDPAGPATQIARIYPWGDTFDRTRCNTQAGGPGRTTPVGRYPSGASPCGAQDMAGNVWEWTNTKYSIYPYNAQDYREKADGTGQRIIRGGSWASILEAARVTRRGGADPNITDHSRGDHGFRIVLAPPIS